MVKVTIHYLGISSVHFYIKPLISESYHIMRVLFVNNQWHDNTYMSLIRVLGCVIFQCCMTIN